MTRKTELINIALHALIDTALSEPVLRGMPLGGFEGGKFASFIDAPAGEPVEEYFNTQTFDFLTVASLVVATEVGEPPERALWIDEIVSSVETALASDLSLGGLVVSVRAAQANVDTAELFGAADITAAQLDFNLDYWTNSRLG